MTKTPLFPFHISKNNAVRIATTNDEYRAAFEKESQFNNITDLDIWGSVTADKKLNLNAWCATESGFCSTAGTFWRKTFELTQEQFDAYVSKELGNRAEAELRNEEDALFKLRVAERVAKLREDLKLEA